MARIDPFLVLLLGAALLGTFLPATGGVFDAVQVISMVGIGLLFFLYGARLSTAETMHNLRNWRLQLTILATTFVVLPAMGLATQLVPSSWLNAQLAAGLLLLTLVPSTMQGCVVYTRMAGGNVAAAVVSASTSNLVGIAATPLLVATLMGGEAKVSADSILRIVLQLLAPFVLGQLLRPVLGWWVEKHDAKLKRFDRSTILLIVYVAFCEGAQAGIWSAAPPRDFVIVLVLCSALLAVAMGWTVLAGRLGGFARPDRMALLFCGSTKSLAAGLPMTSVLFPSDLVAFVVLPLMIYHQLQIMIGSVLATRLGRHAAP